MTHERRQLRVRVLEALEGLAKQFRRREELWPLRVPREPVGLDEVIEQALGEDAQVFQAHTLRSRTRLRRTRPGNRPTPARKGKTSAPTSNAGWRSRAADTRN